MWGANMLKVYSILSSYFNTPHFNTEPADDPGIDFENDGEFWAYKDYPELYSVGGQTLRDLRHDIRNEQDQYIRDGLTTYWPEDWSHLLTHGRFRGKEVDSDFYWEKGGADSGADDQASS